MVVIWEVMDDSLADWKWSGKVEGRRIYTGSKRLPTLVFFKAPFLHAVKRVSSQWEMRTLTGTWDMVHSALPWQALWAVTFHIWAVLLTSSPDTPMHHGRALGEVWLGQSVMCLKTWQHPQAFPLWTTQFNVTKEGLGRVLFCRNEFILICIFSCKGERGKWRGKRNQTC